MDITKQTNLATQTGSHAQDARQTHMEMLVGYILMVGVLVSGTLIVAGTLWNWITIHSLSTTFTISGQNFFGFLAASFQQLFAGQLQPHLLIKLGIIILMLTPYLRVAASAVFFALVEHNLKYSLFTLFVFSVLTYSLFLR